MNKTKPFLTIGFLLIGVIAFFAAPLLFDFEPVFVLRLGVGAVISIASLFAFLGLQLVQYGTRLEEKRSRKTLDQANNWMMPTWIRQ